MRILKSLKRNLKSPMRNLKLVKHILLLLLLLLLLRVTHLLLLVTHPPPPPPPSDIVEPDLNKETFAFQHPFTMIVAGPTMSGKSTWIKELLLHPPGPISPPPDRIIWIYKRWQLLYDELRIKLPTIEFTQGLVDIKSDTYINSKVRTLIIIDDLMKDATQDKDVCELFIEPAHHRKLSVICHHAEPVQQRSGKQNNEFKQSIHGTF